MAEYIVDCAEVPHDSGVLVLPISINGHVHERLIRCKDCLYAADRMPIYCRIWHSVIWNEYAFCYRAARRSGDG